MAFYLFVGFSSGFSQFVISHQLKGSYTRRIVKGEKKD